ncbi:uncharacterized protein LOC141601950 [Silene latifolia]|uniref:uncharacterized protein LOC141601950 n=1 Tax=Silene latifolia TaxID=37657 RepID=UPI003D7713B7
MASASNTLSSTLPIFGGENYDYWCIKMKALLKSNALWEIVENGPEKQQEGVQPTEASLKKINEDEIKDAKALSFIFNAVSETIFPKIMRASTAKEAWDSLQKEFHGDERIRTIRLNTLRKDFENLKMRENEDIQTYTSRVTEIVNQMKIYESRDLSKLKVTELHGSLLAYDQKFKTEESSSEDAFKSSHKEKRSGGWKKKSDDGGNKQVSQSKGKFPPCGICGKNNHAEKNCFFKGKPECHHCKKYGHFKKDCRQKQMESKDQAHYSSSVNNEHLFYAGQAKTSSKESRWLIDSGCTSHMTNDSSIFSELDTSVQTPVRMGNGEVLTSKGKGTIIVPTKRGTKYIKDVLLVPDLAENLLSVAQMIKNGYSLVFANNHCTIYDPGNKEIAKVAMENKSFSLKWKYGLESSYRAHAAETWLWHRRYGHFNLRALADLHKQNVVRDFPMIQATKELCEPC